MIGSCAYAAIWNEASSLICHTTLKHARQTFGFEFHNKKITNNLLQLLTQSDGACHICVCFMCYVYGISSVCICNLVRSKTSSGQGEKSARDGSSQRVPRQVSATRGQKSAKSSGSSSSSSQLTSNWSSSWITQHMPNLLKLDSVLLLMKVPVELEDTFSL